MRLLLVMAIAACEHGQSPVFDGPLGDGPGRAVCEQQFDDAIVRGCSVETDCTLADHDDCCGIVVLGIAKSNAGAFPDIEAELERCSPCPPLGCQHADLSEDGKTLMGGDAFAAICVANRCTSTVR